MAESNLGNISAKAAASYLASNLSLLGVMKDSLQSLHTHTKGLLCSKLCIFQLVHIAQ